MFNFSEIQISSFVTKGNLSWWTREAEWLTTRFDKWLSSYRGCQMMLPESDDDTASSDESLKLPEVQKLPRTKRSYSQSTSPIRQNRSTFSPQTTENIKEKCNGNTIDSVDEEADEVDSQIPDVKVIDEEYKRQFRQPYGWTDYTKDDTMNKQNNNNKRSNERPIKKTESSVEIARHSSIECCNCCYEFCLEERKKSVNCVAYDSKDRSKKAGPFQVITNKISQANSTCDKYFSFRRRRQVHTTQEENFFACRRRRSTYNKSSRLRYKRKVVFGGGGENDPMWPGVMLTFNRGISANNNVVILHSLPETVL